MNRAAVASRILVVIGLVTMLIGTIDPLEGSLAILPGSGMVALGALVRHSRHRPLLYFAFVMVLVGVGAMWGLSGLGGIGGPTGRSMWWATILLPYPVGWLLTLVGAVRLLREAPRAPGPSTLGMSG